MSAMDNADGLALVSTVFAIIFTVFQVRNHLLFNLNPKLRKHTVRILGMVPIYGFTSYLGMMLPSHAIGFGVVRDCYESLVLYSFFQFLIVSLGGKNQLGDILAHKPQVLHIWPMNFMQPWPMGNRFLQLTAVGILQYVPIKIGCAVVTFVSYMNGCYGYGQFKTNKAYPWIAFVVNCSQCWALYCLALLYLGTREELASIKPVPKFAAIKLLVFFTWWQSLCFAGAVQLGWITDATLCYTPNDCWTKTDVSQSLQDFIICTEMFVFAIAHHFIFSVPNPIEYDMTTREDWENVTLASQEKSAYQNLLQVVNMTDLVHDAQDVQKPVPMESYQSYSVRCMDQHKVVGVHGF